MATIKVKNGNNWENIALASYPIGSIYISFAKTSPSELFGGTWLQLKDNRVLRMGDIIETGGSDTVTITSANLPRHTHSVGAHTHGLNNHTHTGGAHTHTLSSHTHSIDSHTHTLTLPTVSSSGGGGATGAPSNNTTGGPSNNTSGGPSNNSTSEAGSHTHAWGANYVQMSADAAGSTVVTTNSVSNFPEGYAGHESWRKTCPDGTTIIFEDGAHTHTLNSHTHSLSNHTHGMQNHTHKIPNHTHTLTGGSIGSKALTTKGPSTGNTSSAGAVATGGPSVANTASSTAFNTSDGAFANTAISVLPAYQNVYAWKRTR